MLLDDDQGAKLIIKLIYMLLEGQQNNNNLRWPHAMNIALNKEERCKQWGARDFFLIFRDINQNKCCNLLKCNGVPRIKNCFLWFSDLGKSRNWHRYLQLALFALISSIAATSIGSGSGNILLVVDNLPTRFGLWPFRRGQIGQIGHIPNGRRWVAGRCGQGHCGRQYSLPRRWSWCWTRDQGGAGSAAYPGHSCHCCYLQW